MTKIIFFFSLFFIFQLTNAQDFRNVTWGDSPEVVKKKETLSLKQVKSTRAKLETLSCIEFKKDSIDEEYSYTYSYVFYDKKLIGIKIKTVYLVKENSRYTISLLYKKTVAEFKAKYKNKCKEIQNTKDGLYKLNVIAHNSRVFLEMKQGDGEFYLLETIMKKNGGIPVEEL